MPRCDGVPSGGRAANVSDNTPDLSPFRRTAALRSVDTGSFSFSAVHRESGSPSRGPQRDISRWPEICHFHLGAVKPRGPSPLSTDPILWPSSDCRIEQAGHVRVKAPALSNRADLPSPDLIPSKCLAWLELSQIGRPPIRLPKRPVHAPPQRTLGRGSDVSEP